MSRTICNVHKAATLPHTPLESSAAAAPRDRCPPLSRAVAGSIGETL